MFALNLVSSFTLLEVIKETFQDGSTLIAMSSHASEEAHFLAGSPPVRFARRLRRSCV